ncbi:MAG: potassium-transporting ATPase subunit KdpC [Candidatus Omnitrophica bacterium]|nr:potassium-transporting ATPase subunit KdpC [Candidatus Omnitrophota bacterium]
MTWREQIRPTLMILIVMTVMTGVVYPLLVTGIAQVCFHRQANGSLIYSTNGKIVGSTLIGQSFDDPKYFWGRLSATTPLYNASSSSGSNLGPSNPALLDNIKARIAALKAADPANTGIIPVDLVTASASGLDPHLSIAGAHYQLSRVAWVRKLPEAFVQQIIDQNTTGRFLGVIGEPVVNILAVNLALDQVKRNN